MRTYRRQKYARYGRMGKGSASRERVGGTASGSADDTAVGLNDGKKVGISIELEIGHIRRWSTVNHQLVENLELGVLYEIRVGNIAVFRGAW